MLRLTTQSGPLRVPSSLPLKRGTNSKFSNFSKLSIRRFETTNTKPGFLSKERIVADKSYNRWKMVPAALATHLCIGSAYAWSLFNEPLIRDLGVVTAAASDWNFSVVVPVFSTILAMHGISAAIFGKWQEKAGPRASGIAGAFCFGGGLMLGGIGVLSHQIWLLYLGYGFLGGCGLGLAYVPPVATLLRWFPDRRGMATGLTIMGFGGGALVATPIVHKLLHVFSKAPEYVGSLDTVKLITQGGKRFVEIAGELKEVVVANASDLAGGPFHHLNEGVYLVGTGSTGAGSTLFILGAAYFVTMVSSAIAYQTPPEGYLPAGYTPPTKSSGMISLRNVHIDNVLSTPQFWQIWITFTCIASAGMSVVSVATTMMNEIFGKALPLIVTGAFTSSYVMSISAANLGGRLFWSSVSDYLGRKNVFTLFSLCSIPLYLIIPYLVAYVSTNPSAGLLIIFYSSTLLIFSFFGGCYATVPAYEADLFGSKYVGAIHGRMLTASSAAALIGPLAITKLRKTSEYNAVKELISKINPETFSEKFGANISDWETLFSAKTVTINKLMTIAPRGTPDPTPFLYNSTMFFAISLLSVAAISNLAIRPVNPKFLMISEIPEKTGVSAVSEFIPENVFLVAVDGSVYSEKAFLWAVNQMNREKDRIVIIMVDKPHVHAFSQPPWPDMPADAHLTTRGVLHKFSKMAHSMKIDCSSLMAISLLPGESIIAAAKMKGAGTLVLGFHGRGTITSAVQAVLGSITKFCLENAPCNVMIVKPNYEGKVKVPEFEEFIPNSEDWETVHQESPLQNVDSVTPITIMEHKPKINKEN